MQGYWNNPEATASSIVTIDGKRTFLTGDKGKTGDKGGKPRLSADLNEAEVVIVNYRSLFFVD